MRVRRMPLILSSLAMAAVAVSGCAAPGSADPSPSGASQSAHAEGDFSDPWEDTNREIFVFNQTVDRNVLLPVAKTYRTVVPDPIRDGVHNVLQNLNGPMIFANDVLQGEVKLAGNTFARVVINTTAGLGGLFDPATHIGIPYHPNDLGITLATWGIAEGPYLIIPVLGPSNPRDLAGRVGDGFGDPANYFAGQHDLILAVIARTATSGIDERERNIDTLAEIEKTALDYYATIRSLYRQRRQAEIRHEQSNLPNPTPVQGGDSGPQTPISYTVAPTPQPKEAPAK